jgi:hypothetical protein
METRPCIISLTGAGDRDIQTSSLQTLSMPWLPGLETLAKLEKTKGRNMALLCHMAPPPTGHG